MCSPQLWSSFWRPSADLREQMCASRRRLRHTRLLSWIQTMLVTRKEVTKAIWLHSCVSSYLFIAIWKYSVIYLKQKNRSRKCSEDGRSFPDQVDLKYHNVIHPMYVSSFWFVIFIVFNVYPNYFSYFIYLTYILFTVIYVSVICNSFCLTNMPRIYFLHQNKTWQHKLALINFGHLNQK